MNPMLQALKSRRMTDKQAPEAEEPSETDPQDLTAFVKSLTPEQKQHVSQLIDKGDVASGEQVAKGSPSSEEKGKIQQRMAEENAEQGLEAEQPPVDSDDIAMGMLDKRFASAPPTKPRNLHERVQSNMANNLKAKGKI